ncbi:MAG: glycosyltransferase family 39 protein [Eubacteriales bacterium]|nr:glycosyltransferase family 39 protein [Eubacteriales bacterium]
MGKRKVRWLYGMAAGIFSLIAGFLMLLSVFLHCETNIYTFEMEKTIEPHTPVLYCGLALIGILLVVLLCALLQFFMKEEKQAERMRRAIFRGCGAVLFAVGLCWILFNDCVPTLDQMDSYKEAERIAGFRDEPYDTDYLSSFPRNRGIVLLMAGVLRLFGDSYFPFRLINLFAVLVIYGCVCKTTLRMYRNPVVSAAVSVLFLLCYPLLCYASFLYGTLLAIAFESLGFYAVLALCQTNRKRYAIIAACAFPLGILMHQSAVIAWIAAVIYLLLKTERRTIVRNLCLGVSSLVLLFAAEWAVNHVYCGITGADIHGSSVPASCTVYMGLTSTQGDSGPGSQDGSYTDIFAENQNDEEAANRDALHRISVVLQEYVAGERKLTFFLEKIEYQWLDPTFGARKIIKMNDVDEGDPPNSGAFVAFYNSPLRSTVFKLSVGVMLAMYIGAFGSGILTMKRAGSCPAAILPQIYVIGGFLFQLFWESLSRYCLGYYIWLLPGTVWAIYTIGQSVKAALPGKTAVAKS